MAFHKKFTTSIKQIVDYYSTNCNEEDLACDVSEIYRRCWRCGGVCSIVCPKETKEANR